MKESKERAGRTAKQILDNLPRTGVILDCQSGHVEGNPFRIAMTKQHRPSTDDSILALLSGLSENAISARLNT